MVSSCIACVGLVVIGAVVMTQPPVTADDLIDLLQLAAVVFVVCLVWLCYSYKKRTTELRRQFALL